MSTKNSKKSKSKKLSHPDLLFCHEYLANGENATEAYHQVHPRVTRKTAGTEGHKLLKKPEIVAKIAELRLARLQRAEKTADDVVRELEKIGFANITDVVHWNESGASFVHNAEDMPRDVSAAIESVQVTEDQLLVEGQKADRTVLKTKVKMHSKTKALELLGKEHGLFVDKHEITLRPCSVNFHGLEK